MTAFDYIVLAIIAASALISILRGMVREVVSLASWIAAFIAANTLSASVVDWVPAVVTNPAARYLLAFASIFLTTIIVLELFGVLLSKLVHAVGLSFLDRMLGALFGFARGVLIVLVLVLLGGLTNLPRSDWWQNAALSPPLQTAVLAMRPWMPVELAKRLNYSAPGGERNHMRSGLRLGEGNVRNTRSRGTHSG